MKVKVTIELYGDNREAVTAALAQLAETDRHELLKPHTAGESFRMGAFQVKMPPEHKREYELVGYSYAILEPGCHPGSSFNNSST